MMNFKNFLAVKMLFFCFIVLFISHSCKYQIVLDLPWKKQNDSSFSRINFIHEKFDRSIDSAQHSQSFVFLDFYTSWCAPCKVMDKETFTNSRVVSILNSNFISLKINGEKNEGPTLVQNYNVKAYPTLIFLNRDGQEVLRYEGLLTAPKFIHYLNKTLKR